MAFSCKAVTRTGAKLNVLGYYRRSLLNSFTCPKEPHVFRRDILILLILPPQHEQCLWEVFVGQESQGCNVAEDVPHSLQKLVLRTVFPSSI